MPLADRIQALLALALLIAAPACASSDATPAPIVGAPASLNANFVSDELDVESYVEAFEGESREIATSRRAIVAALGLARGMDVADIGAGTGLFLSPLASSLGDGTLFAVDISPRFTEHMRQRAASEGLPNVDVVLCDERSTRLAAGSVDLVFVCDTYHHFEYPSDTLASIHAALRPGGRLVVVDFERIEGVSRQWLLEHVRAGKQVFRAEIESADFAFDTELDVEGLSENYVLVFTKG